MKEESLVGLGPLEAYKMALDVQEVFWGRCLGRMKEMERRRPGGGSSHGDAGLTPGKGGERKEGWWEESHTAVQISKQSIAKLTGAPKQDTLVCSGCCKKTPQTR